MSKLLFLEGPIQTGKSTLIRQALAGFDCSSLAGFTSQRLTSGGDTIAFRIAAAGEPLTRPLNEVISGWPNLDADECLAKGIFKYFGEFGMKKHSEVFEGIALDYLTDALSTSPPLVLLDEIGGHELAVPVYRQALRNLLASGIPCIGVIKHPESTKRMDASLVKLNADLHRFIEDELGGSILYFDRDAQTSDEAREAVRAFICAHIQKG